ncbi:MAG: diheme cytochrome c [Desulfobulbaceae bacterium]|nr:diheme cytochrome c [Desulfobulbaceae bacterium]
MKSTLFFLATILFFPLLAFADDDHHEGSKHLPVVTNETYKNSCGSCHFAYQPGLMPSKSWVKILDEPNAHPGGDLSLDEKTKAEIKNYLTQNSAEYSPSKKSKKIMGSIGSETPVRISEIPYIKHKHHEINQEVFTRKAIGSRANCIACHKGAESGIYDNDDIPHGS